MLQNLPYFWNKKTQIVVFFIFHFELATSDLLVDSLVFNIDQDIISYNKSEVFKYLGQNEKRKKTFWVLAYSKKYGKIFRNFSPSKTQEIVIYVFIMQ